MTERLVCCFLCHRYRKPKLMDGTRCSNRVSCALATRWATGRRRAKGDVT